MKRFNESNCVVFEFSSILAYKECLKHSLIINLRCCSTPHLKKALTYIISGLSDTNTVVSSIHETCLHGLILINLHVVLW